MFGETIEKIDDSQGSLTQLINPLKVCDIILRVDGTSRKHVWRNIT